MSCAWRLTLQVLKKQGRRQVEDVGEKDLQACHAAFFAEFPKEAGSVPSLGRFLLEHGYVQPVTAPDQVELIT